MATFTENQVRQFYVATATGSDVIAPVQLDSSHAATDLKAKSAGACQFVISNDGDTACLNYKGPSDDGVQRSDVLKKCNVVSVNLTDAADMVHKNRKAVITLAAAFKSSSNLAVAGDYVLNVEIQNYIAIGNDSIKVKFGAVRGTTSTTASDFYKKMAISLAKNFARESVPMVKIGISTAATGASPTEITAKTDISSLSSITAASITIEEVEQPWRRGAAKVEYVNFNVYASELLNGGVDQIWGKVQFAGSAKYTDGTSSSDTVSAGGTQKNSKAVADMEWFFHKERGDQYAEVGFPNNIDTTYQVDPANTDGYSFIDIHYYELGNSHNVGKSEKTLTVVGTKANLKKLFGSPATTGQSATPATGLYLWLDGTGVNIKTSASW